MTFCVCLEVTVAIEMKIVHWWDFLSAVGFSDCLTYIYVGFGLIFDPCGVSYIARYPIPITPSKYKLLMSLNSLCLGLSQADNSTKSRFNWSEFSSYVLLIPWWYPILFDLLVIGCRQFILFISRVFSPVSIRSDGCKVNYCLWVKSNNNENRFFSAGFYLTIFHLAFKYYLIKNTSIRTVLQVLINIYYLNQSFY